VRLRYETILLDAYPDGLVALGTLRERSALVRVWRALNARAYRGAQHIIVIGRDMIGLLHDRYGVDRRHVTYIPHWGPKEAEGMPAERGSLLARLGLDRKFVVQYSGNMGLWHDMEALVRVAEHLRNDDRIHFLFMGKGRRREAAETLARRLKLTNITWLDFAPREELATALASCDAALISLRAGMEGVAVPSKLYGILAAGRPVLAMVPPNSEVGQTVREEGCGCVVPPGDVEGMVRAIRELAATPAIAEEMGHRARAAYSAKYTIDHAANAYRRLWAASDQDEMPD
ncbi:MAG TPA: glycosyltransferase family 4 protein, partial [Chloroflexota bacterium]|nr:glycosyltransferase family 4 protein [Chloroflexota bacterium]